MDSDRCLFNLFIDIQELTNLFDPTVFLDENNWLDLGRFLFHIQKKDTLANDYLSLYIKASQRVPGYESVSEDQCKKAWEMFINEIDSELGEIFYNVSSYIDFLCMSNKEEYDQLVLKKRTQSIVNASFDKYIDEYVISDNSHILSIDELYTHYISVNTEKYYSKTDLHQYMVRRFGELVYNDSDYKFGWFGIRVNVEPLVIDITEEKSDEFIIVENNDLVLTKNRKKRKRKRNKKVVSQDNLELAGSSAPTSIPTSGANSVCISPLKKKKKKNKNKCLKVNSLNKSIKKYFNKTLVPVKDGYISLDMLKKDYAEFCYHKGIPRDSHFIELVNEFLGKPQTVYIDGNKYTHLLWGYKFVPINYDI